VPNRSVHTQQTQEVQSTPIPDPKTNSGWARPSISLPETETDTNAQEKLRTSARGFQIGGERKSMRTMTSEPDPYNAPTNQPQTSFNQPQTSFNQPQNSVGRRYANPNPVDNNFKRNRGTATSTFNQPDTSFNQPETSFNQPQTSFNQPQTSFNQPQTSFNQPQTSFNQPETTFNQPETTFSQPETTFNPQPPITNTALDSDVIELNDDFFDNLDPEIMLAGWLDVLDMSVAVPGSEAFEVRQSMRLPGNINFSDNNVIESLDDFGDLDDILGSIDQLSGELDFII